MVLTKTERRHGATQSELVAPPADDTLDEAIVETATGPVGDGGAS